MTKYKLASINFCLASLSHFFIFLQSSFSSSNLSGFVFLISLRHTNIRSSNFLISEISDKIAFFNARVGFISTNFITSFLVISFKSSKTLSSFIFSSKEVVDLC
ncbi:TPA: hypothetical protein DCZ31_04385 [Patescibacteria group bacterium]|nr:hypothetical protein [Candidatus Gracilibacteria bacterium]